MTVKTCKTCGETKHLSAFYKHPKTSDGYLNQCKECKKAAVRKQRIRNPLVIQRERLRNKSSERIADKKKRIQNSPWLSRARWTVQNAIRDGLLAPASACECADCGHVPAQVLHHHSYEEDNLLNVIPLCRPCHGIRHAYPERFLPT